MTRPTLACLAVLVLLPARAHAAAPATKPPPSVSDAILKLVAHLVYQV